MPLVLSSPGQWDLLFLSVLPGWVGRSGRGGGELEVPSERFFGMLRSYLWTVCSLGLDCRQLVSKWGSELWANGLPHPTSISPVHHFTLPGNKWASGQGLGGRREQACRKKPFPFLLLMMTLLASFCCIAPSTVDACIKLLTSPSMLPTSYPSFSGYRQFVSLVHGDCHNARWWMGGWESRSVEITALKQYKHRAGEVGWILVKTQVLH